MTLVFKNSKGCFGLSEVGFCEVLMISCLVSGHSAHSLESLKAVLKGSYGATQNEDH